ncbi:MAG: hypothetical protein JWR68_2294 [Polaromonas sp.]|nr:hypothetical protein [Polaromonas sp.]
MPPDTMEKAAEAAPLRLSSREQLAHLLAEAAELEHNLLCCYLYAAFSLKTPDQGGVAAADARRVEKWRASIMQVAMEEMTHLALIANLSVAIGVRPHFNRPNLPVAPLYHPADIVVELAPFSLDTLDHFIYLERPEGSDLPDGQSFARRRENYQRGDRPGASLMPSAMDYATIGEFYAHLRACFIDLANAAGESLFCGDPSMQVGPDKLDLPGMATIAQLDDALAALDTIVTQGEGGCAAEESHFARFMQIRDELAELQARGNAAAPAWPAARNPLMRKPADPASGVHVTAPAAAAVLDLGNAVYALTLRLLAQAWGGPGGERHQARPAAALQAAMQLMRVLGGIGQHLCSLPARPDLADVHAGLTFAVPRATEPLVAAAETLWIGERLAELLVGLKLVARVEAPLQCLVPQLQAIARRYATASPPLQAAGKASTAAPAAPG